jgi:hypothetical protein
MVPSRRVRIRSTVRRYFSAAEASGPIGGQIVDSPQSFTSGEVRSSWFKARDQKVKRKVSQETTR